MTRKTKKNRNDGSADLGRNLIAAAKEVLAHVRGEIELPYREYPSPKRIDVAPIRKKMGMSQVIFANTFGLKVSTLRDWEQGRRQPDGTARILLAIIAKHPAVVSEVLEEFQ